MIGTDHTVTTNIIMKTATSIGAVMDIIVIITQWEQFEQRKVN